MTVQLYTLPDCSICHMIKKKLESKAIIFDECDFNDIAESMGLERAPLLKVTTKDETQYFMSPSKMVEWINAQ